MIADVPFCMECLDSLHEVSVLLYLQDRGLDGKGKARSWYNFPRGSDFLIRGILNKLWTPHWSISASPVYASIFYTGIAKSVWRCGPFMDVAGMFIGLRTPHGICTGTAKSVWRYWEFMYVTGMDISFRDTLLWLVWDIFMPFCLAIGLDTVFSERILLWSMDLRGSMNLCILWIRVCFPYIGGFQYSCHGICWCTRSLCNYGVYNLWNMCIEMKGKFYIMKILCEAGLLNFAFLKVPWLACFGVYKRTFMKFGFFVQSEITSWLVKRLWRICLSLCFFVCEIKFHNCECCVQIVMYFWNGMIVESTEEWICVVFRAE